MKIDYSWFSEEIVMDITLIKAFWLVVFGYLFSVVLSTGAGLAFLAALILYFITGGWKIFKISVLTFIRDAKAAAFLVLEVPRMYKYTRQGVNIVTLFERTCKRFPDKTAVIMVDDRSWTFRQIDEYSNAVANYFYEQGYRKGDVVAIFMESRPEFIMLWLGLAKIGVVSALINYNLRMDALLHCLKESQAKSIIFGTELLHAIIDVSNNLPSSLALFCQGALCENGLQMRHIDPLIAKSSTLPPPKDHVTRLNEKLFYIYTSGTTGLPKAAAILHSRFYYMSYSVYFMYDFTSDDVIYDTLPMYHANGTVLGVGNCLIRGCTVVLRKKFSASRYWDDCIRYNCTIGQYIGEICRYLLAQPPKLQDRQHKVRIMFGNGIKPQIWTEFKERFNIGKVGEFYGSTEGNASLLNWDNTPGAIGFISRSVPWAYPVKLIKVDQVTGELLRNSNGLCIKCKPGEPGELVGKIVAGNPMRSFEGYSNPEATKKKIAHNVLRMGDKYFRTGDIMVMDDYGYVFFRDRTGDTFRWKGENVSTTEVEALISNIIQLNDAVVFGVEIPDTEGKAGMAVLLDEFNRVDLNKFSSDLKNFLPSYARPLFLRFTDLVDKTGTFKLKKVDYQKDAYNPSIIKDRLYYFECKSSQYLPLDQKAYEAICSGVITF